ncbi:Stigma-specific STIG1-like protein [Drosera capensis]
MSLAFSKGVGLFIIKKLKGIQELQQKSRQRDHKIPITQVDDSVDHTSEKTTPRGEIYISKKEVLEEMKVTLKHVLHMLPVVLLLTMAIVVEANVQQHKMDRSTSSLFINKLTKSRTRGCKPGGCGPGKTCCGTTCVDNNTDTNHCGVCGLKCPFSWKCCDGECANVKFNPSHCGKCGNKCGGGNKVCMYSMCNYVHEIPPWTTRINATDVPNTASSTDHQGSN